jgi:N-acetylmuramoyl-L-alanine amidase/Secretion system C-terminal sorting domain
MKIFITILLVLSSFMAIGQMKKGETVTKEYDFSHLDKGAFDTIEKFRGCIYAPLTDIIITYIGKKELLDLENPTPFISFSCKWEEGDIMPKNSEIAIRFSKNGTKWVGYQKIKMDAHADNGLVNYSELQFLDKEFKYYQVKVTTNLNRKGREIKSLTLNFFNPGKETGIIEQKPIPNEMTNKQLQPLACPCPIPTYITRTQWNCPQGQGQVSGVGTSAAVTHLIVHHSDGPNTSTNWNATVLSIWNYHVGTNGWSDIGYNWLITPDGTLYEGRGSNSLDDNVTGAHFCGTNGSTMGVCMVGTYTSADITAAARATLNKVLAWKCCKANIPPIGTALHSSSGLTLNRISGHRDGCATDCPGNTFYATLPQLRTDVDNTINSCTSVTPCTPSVKVTSTGCPNNSITFSPNNIVNGGTSPSFAWYLNNNFIVNGPTYNLINAVNSDKVYARMTSNASCATPTQVNSDTLTISCIVTPVIDIDGLEYCRVAPNPNSGNFTVNMNITKSTLVQYRITDALGKQLLITTKERVLGIVNKRFDIPHLSSGNYFLEIYFNGKKLILKLVIV